MLNTLPDPRTSSTASVASRSDSIIESNTGDPTLNEEIAKLSEKLVNAINHQTNLDDTLQQTRHELDLANQTIAKLEAEAKAHENKITQGLLITKAAHDKREIKFAAELQAEKDLKGRAELDKKAMQAEVETLTSALFQEANTMVADARREKEAVDRKNDQLRNQLRDMEDLLQSQQEQLQDLKSVLERMTYDQADADSVTHSSNAPSSPMAPNDRMSRMFESAHHFSPNSSTMTADGVEAEQIEAVPNHPLHFAHLVQPVLRTDIQAYTDFASVIKSATAAATSPPHSRVASGSYGSMAPILNSVNGSNSQLNNSLTTPPIPGGFPTGPTSPRIGASPPPTLPSLRETKLFKRALAEDIEPTLRLDIAPGVSWMVRRAVINSMVDGTLVVEPMPAPPVKFRGPVNACSLCGENRIGDEYKRKHRFRLSEDRERRGFPLCDHCLGRLRSCGDLLSFLRMVAGGHWRAERDEDVRNGWEEYVKLREKMFWCRMAGGVVPTSAINATKTESGTPVRNSEEKKERTVDDDPFTKYSESKTPESVMHSVEVTASS
jgi:Rab guanine nucleotide exchange factor SEC2